MHSHCLNQFVGFFLSRTASDYIFHSLASLQKVKDLEMLEGSMGKWKRAQKLQGIALPIKAMFFALCCIWSQLPAWHWSHYSRLLNLGVSKNSTSGGLASWSVKSCKVNPPVRCYRKFLKQCFSLKTKEVSRQRADLQLVLLQSCACLVVGAIVSLWVKRRREFDTLWVMPQGPNYMKHWATSSPAEISLRWKDLMFCVIGCQHH